MPLPILVKCKTPQSVSTLVLSAIHNPNHHESNFYAHSMQFKLIRDLSLFEYDFYKPTHELCLKLYI